MIDKKTIDDFYANKRIAVIGASRKKLKYGSMLFSYLKKKGFDAVPVNPNAESIGGVKAFARVQDVEPKVEAAIAVVPPSQQEIIVNDCAEAGVKSLWLHEHVMKGISNTKAIAACEQKGVSCIVGFCPMMFIPNTGFPHNFHAMIMKVFGAFPK